MLRCSYNELIDSDDIGVSIEETVCKNRKMRVL